MGHCHDQAPLHKACGCLDGSSRAACIAQYKTDPPANNRPSPPSPAEPKHTRTGAVLDGRDIGTVICPDAPVKLYVTADVAVRAQRRLDELLARQQGADAAGSVSFEAVLADMKARDDRDMNRATAPLKPADDAVILDTTHMSIHQAFDKARSAVEAALLAQQQQQQQQHPVAA
jgi:hypothetical protein